ncbi:MAG: extracellular solute-binding protein [Nocardioidaceae bacterium]|nr:extracellular solute-binding protein [Nocardioidaceae bacterium]MCL2615032.1 extracellular solute-binding protein [Nocardioidaceae bacterium]
MNSARIGWRALLVVGVVVAAVLAAMLVVSAHTHAPGQGDDSTTVGTRQPSSAPVHLTFGVWGSKREIATYRGIAASYHRANPTATITLRVYPSSSALASAVKAGKVPSVYLLSRDDLGGVMRAKGNVSVQDLMSDRGVNLGDDYSRGSLAAFTANDDLQCMPYTASPMVIYFNTDLVDVSRMRARGIDAPSPMDPSFTIDQFRAAARFAAHRRGHHAAGVAIEPSLTALAPFVLSGGGNLFDDDQNPTRLAVGDGSASDALRQTLEILRDPRLTLSDAQLRQRSALQWFERGRVGMIAGFRDLVPQLRAVKGLHFDVLPMPILGSAATVGSFTGMCLARHQRRDLGGAADFLTYLVGRRAMTRVAEIGSLQPADIPVAYSKAFTQPDARPAHAAVFTSTLRNIQLTPLGVPWQRLDQAVGPQLRQLMNVPVLDDLDKRLTAIDQRSKAVLSAPAASSGGARGGSKHSARSGLKPRRGR